MLTKRGALIIVEGGDRCGKSTFSKGLVSLLLSKGIQTKYLNFPDRTTEIGKIIDKYLRAKDGVCSDETIHLLFAANRWEWAPKIKTLLNEGTTLVVDRYAFSGVAYSAAKGLDMNWCKSVDTGLPRPDRVYLLKLDSDVQATRNGFGEERFDNSPFQEKVFSCFLKMQESNWETLNASKDPKILQEDVAASVQSLIGQVEKEPIRDLWRE